MKKRISTKTILLWLLKAGGLAVLSIVAPQLPTVLLKGYLKERHRLKNRLRRLEDKGWIKITSQSDQYKLELVQAGRIKALYYQLDSLKITKPSEWDGLWRVLVFDIPEEKKIARDVLRRKIKELGFLQLQKSVFIFPYDCRKEIEVVKSAYEIWPYLTYMEVQKIDHDKKLKDKFDL